MQVEYIYYLPCIRRSYSLDSLDSPDSSDSSPLPILK